MPNFTDNSRVDNASWLNISIMLCRMVLAMLSLKINFPRIRAGLMRQKIKASAFSFSLTLKFSQ
jgi:hypothetical protein